MERQIFHVRVERIFDDSEYSYFSFYNVQGCNPEDVRVPARERFAADFGAPYEKTKIGYIFDKPFDLERNPVINP